VSEVPRLKRRRALKLAGLASALLIGFAMAPSTSLAKLKFEPLSGQYRGSLGDVGTISFTVKKKKAEIKDFQIVIFPEPTCSSPPQGWSYPLPRNTEYHPVSDAHVYLYKGWRVSPIPSPLEMNHGFYPFPIVPESRQVSAQATFLARFKTSSKVRGGELVLGSTNFVPNGPCQHVIVVPSWTAKHR